MKSVLCASLLVLLLLAGPSAGQVTTATILGTVSDHTGAVIPNVQVTAVQTETNFTRIAKTDGAGQYAIRFLPLGTYQVQLDAAGFKQYQQSGIVLDVNRNARVDPVLEVGNLNEKVSVVADAPLVDTSSASIGRTVENQEILNLPLVNRDLYTLLNLTPGVDSSASGSVGLPAQDTVVNGSPNSMGAVGYYVDGGASANAIRNSGNPLPNPDSVQEFRVITNGFGAEFGRFGGGVVDVVTKSGTNSLHGSLFEFIRNDKLNANIWGSSTKPPLRRNQFGGTAGGPIRRNRTFIFGSYSGLRQRQVDYKNLAIVPTTLERNGDFSASKTKPTDPLTKQPFPGNVIPANRLDPTAMNILRKGVPLPNLPGNFYEIAMPHPANTDETLFKVDHSISNTHQFTGSYFREKGQDVEGLAGTVPWSKRYLSTVQHNFNAGETWTLTPSTVNQLRLTYMRNLSVRENQPAASLADFGSAFRPQGPPSLPQITVSGYFTLGQAIAGPVQGSNYYGLREVLSHTRGRHTLKVGGEFTLEKILQNTLLNNYGTFSFDGSKTGNALADYLTGAPRTMNQDAPIGKNDNAWYWALFVQDDFRVLPRLTLNLGLRYDMMYPAKDPMNRQITFVQGVQSRIVPAAPLGLLFPGDPGVGRGIVPLDKNNLGPRVGMAWDPTGSGRTSVRASAGVFFGTINGNTWNGTADRIPFTVRQQFNDVKSLTDPYGNLPGGVSPFPYVYDAKNPRFLPSSGVAGFNLGLRTPYTYQLSFSVQRQLRQDLSVTGAYVGTIGHKFPFQRDNNYPIYGPGATAANVDLRRPIQPGILGAIALNESAANSAYHGLQLTAEKRMSRSFSFKTFYTFSKVLDTVDLNNGNLQQNVQNETNLRNDRGRATLDRTHNFVLSAIWEINYFGAGNRILKNVANGWTLSAIGSARSGTPLTITTGRDNNLDGYSTDRANLAGNPLLDPHRSRSDVTNMWFNTAAFIPNATGQDGTSGRNIIDGPGLKNVDMSLFRTFKLRESMGLQFRAEMTNALNLVSLGSPTVSLNSSALGTIRTARGMRQVQLGLRLAF